MSIPTEELSEDGTLMVHVSDGSKVSRVFVMGDNIFGGLYYPDSDENKGENKHGHWKAVSDVCSDGAYICECSECKDTVWVYRDTDRKWNYCPNCGADMREPKDIIHKAIDNTTFAEEAYPNIKEELHKAVDMAEPIGEKIRCNTCKNNDDELSGECYECVKGIFDHYEPKTEVEHGRTND